MESLRSTAAWCGSKWLRATCWRPTPRSLWWKSGNNRSAQRILSVIARRGRRVEEVSHVIVTHVHLDHAGGAGTLLQRLPNATLVVHPRGARHMIDPSRLEASARAVYGDEEYEAQHGALQPVPEQRVLVMDDGGSLQVGTRTLQFMDTPGHARHHFCVWDEATRGWFSGDTFGISYRELDSHRGPFIFPTTTPIQFDPPALLESIDRLMERAPQNMYLTHFGRVCDLPRLATDMRAAIGRFVEWGETFASHEQRRNRIEEAMMTWLIEGARAHGVTHSRRLVTRDFQWRRSAQYAGNRVLAGSRSLTPSPDLPFPTIESPVSDRFGQVP